MEQALYTVHHKKGRYVEVISDRFDLIALIVPLVWMIWHGVWVMLGLLVFVLVLAWMYSVYAPMAVMYAVGFLLAFEGGAVRRLEFRLRGWRQRGVVEAASADAAEEQFLNGKAA